MGSWATNVYTFDKSETASGDVNPGLLRTELDALGAPLTVSPFVTSSGSTYKAYFASEPDAGGKTSRENAVGNHDHTAQATQQILEHTDTVDPTSSDDIDSGYIIGSKWINTIKDEIWFCTNNATGDAIWKSATALGDKFVYALDMLFPNSAAWPVSAMAPLDPDATESDIVVCLHDDTIEEGNEIIKHVPKFSKQVLVILKAAAQTAPAGARTHAWKIYVRKLEDGAARGTWSAGYTLPDGNIPTDTNMHYYTATVALADIGAVADATNKFQITRVAPAAGTNLEGDLGLMCAGMVFL